METLAAEIEQLQRRSEQEEYLDTGDALDLLERARKTLTDGRTYVVQRYRAPNDENGNPRRLYVLYGVPVNSSSYTTTEAVFDEGYHGLPDTWRGRPQLPTVEIDEATYDQWTRQATERDRLHHYPDDVPDPEFM